jgi:hypothetical protein
MARNRRTNRDKDKDAEENPDTTMEQDGEDEETEETHEEDKSPEPESKDEEEQPKVKQISAEELDPEFAEQLEIIKTSEPQSELEIALSETLKRREEQLERLSGEITKLKAFISKRKQTYKRKRKETGAPTRALSAYNIFVQDKFSMLAKENEQALKSADSEAVLKRVPPASLVASTGNEWKELSAEEKAHYDERAREDRKRYEEQMAKYQPPDKQANRKRNKTGYNMFFSAHVLRLKQTDAGVPSERGSVARLVGNAWKQLTNEEKQYYEREADKQNGMNPVDKDEEDEDDDKRVPPEYMHHVQPELHMHGGMHPGMAQAPPGMQHDPRQHGAYAYPQHPMAYGQPYQGQHYAAQGDARYHQGRTHGYQGYPQQARHPYDNSGMGM